MSHICDPFWENPYKRGHQLFLFVFTYRIYGARGPRLPSLTEITQVFFELWIKTFMHNRSIIISRFRENANALLWPRGVSRFYVYQPPGMSRTSEQCSAYYVSYSEFQSVYLCQDLEQYSIHPFS